MLNLAMHAFRLRSITRKCGENDDVIVCFVRILAPALSVGGSQKDQPCGRQPPTRAD